MQPDHARRLVALAAELASLAASMAEPEPEPEPDVMLDAAVVARRLGISVEALYRKRLPFKVKVSGRCTRYSQRGLEAWLAERSAP